MSPVETRSGGDRQGAPSSRERIYAVVRRIPRGQVATYGQVAELAGLERQARQVGYALAALPQGTRVPWHRVLNARGAIVLSDASGAATEQRIRLMREGVVVNATGRIDLARFRWAG
ncbi:MAG: MGMT family protein [Gemmatimonadaceae bacterium]